MSTQTPTPATPTAGLPSRDQVEDRLKWKLDAIYATDAAWEEDFRRVQEWLPEIKKYQGRLGVGGTHQTPASGHINPDPVDII